jgi:1,4-dihydroxy-2-naphthoyl-CoA synthase
MLPGCPMSESLLFSLDDAVAIISINDALRNRMTLAFDVVVGSEDRALVDLLQAERDAVIATLGTPDQQEGMLAFLEKRRPVFNQPR